MKAVLFVTGAVRDVIEALPRASAGVPPGSLRVVVRAGQRAELVRAGALAPHQVLGVSAVAWLWVWLRLFRFLGWSRQVRVVCLAAGHSRALKLLAFGLRGRVTFTLPAAEAVSLSLPRFLWLSWKTFGRRPGDICLLGTAGGVHLERILADLRKRYPDRAIHALLPTQANGLSADSAARLTANALIEACRRQPRFAILVITCTGNGLWALKLLAWCLPLGYREIYNENNDFYSARDVDVLAGHLWWRLATALRNLPWRLNDWLTRRPNRVTVLGSASGLYLKTIVADLRRRYPGAPLHGLLPAHLVGPAAHLFDSYSALRVFSTGFWGDLLSLSLGRKRSGHLVIPCTDEGYTPIKVLGFWLPLGLREIYNENGDAYLARHLRMLWRHFCWRLEHRIFYQALTVRRGRPWLLHLLHLLAYPLRLAAGAALLVWVLWRSRRAPAPQAAPEEDTLSEDVLAVANGRLERANRSSVGIGSG